MNDTVTRVALPAASAGVATAKPVTPATAGDGGGSRGAILIPQPSATLQALQAGDIIEATIDTRLPDEQVRLATRRYGNLLATWPNAPASGTAVRLQVLSAGPPLKLQIAPPGLGQRPRPTLTPTPAAALAARISATGPSATATPFPALIEPGTILQGRLFPTFNAPANSGRLGATATPPSSQQLSVRVLALQSPRQTKGRPAQAGAGTLQATVLGSGSSHIRLQTGSGDLTVRSTANLPPGTKLTLQILALPGTILPLTSADRAARQITALTQGWPALEKSLQILTTALPEVTARFTSTKLPQPGPRLTSGIIFFLSAVRGGSLQDWLGPDLVRTLGEQNRGIILSQLTDDFARFAQLATEPVSGEWRTALLPFFQGGVFQQLRIYLRDRGQGQSSGNDSDPGTRFVVEAELGQLGALQLDGLIRQKRFDLIMRSHRPLPGTMRDDIQEIFKKSATDANFSGNISFQVEPDFHIAPLEQLAGHAVGMFA